MQKDNSWQLSATQIAACIQQGDMTAEKAAQDAAAASIEAGFPTLPIAEPA